MTQEEIDVIVADKDAIEAALRRVLKFIDPSSTERPVLSLTGPQVAECSVILTEAYRCLWSAHPGAKT